MSLQPDQIEHGVEPPVAPVLGHISVLHGRERSDDYAWLRNSGSREARAVLAAERAYYERRVGHLRPLREELFLEMSARVPATDRSASWDHGSFAYTTRTAAGAELARLCRRPASQRDPDETAPESEEVILDLQAEATTRDVSYLELGVCEPSPDGNLLAWSLDTDGDEVYALRFRDLRTGADLPESLPRTYYGGAWSADSRFFWYVVHDEAHRPFQVWRHLIGTAVGADVCVWTEQDARFDVGLGPLRSGRFAAISISSRDTSEVRLLDTTDAEAIPFVVAHRRAGIEYEVEHARDTPLGDVLLLLTDDGAPEFRLATIGLGEVTSGPAAWAELLPERPDERLLDVDAFEGYVVLSLRREGRLLLRVVPWASLVDPAVEAYEITGPGEEGSAVLGRNLHADVRSVVVRTESWIHPPTWFDVDLATGDRRERHRRLVPGHDPDRYVQERRPVVSIDPGTGRGVWVWVSIVRHRDTPLDGSAPCLLYGYGAYEYSLDPEFDLTAPCLLDRGVVMATAHVRGGGEGGRRWWLDGRLEAKQHTFDDFRAIADAISGEPAIGINGARSQPIALVDGSRLVARGMSAGGLLVGAAYSQVPQRWRAVLAEVPFVDVVTTMLDPDIPLTVGEWDEWGDPRDPVIAGIMGAYAPYDNPPPPEYRPALLVTGAVNDPRVLVHEPAKWVARLRATDPRRGAGTDSSDPASPATVLFRCETGEGSHGGPAGRYARLEHEAELQAWILTAMRTT